MKLWDARAQRMATLVVRQHGISFVRCQHTLDGCVAHPSGLNLQARPAIASFPSCAPMWGKLIAAGPRASGRRRSTTIGDIFSNRRNLAD